MYYNILQGAATLAVAILATDAVKETATGGQNVIQKWIAVIVVLIMVIIVVELLNLQPVCQKNLATS